MSDLLAKIKSQSEDTEQSNDPNALDMSAQAQAGMSVAPVENDEDDQVVDEEANEPQKPEGYYSDHCNMIYVGSGQKYNWPVGAPFPMDKVEKRHKENVQGQLDSMVDRGYAYVVEASDED